MQNLVHDGVYYAGFMKPPKASLSIKLISNKLQNKKPTDIKTGGHFKSPLPFLLFLLMYLLKCHSLLFYSIGFLSLQPLHSLLILFSHNFIYAINFWETHPEKQISHPLVSRAFALASYFLGKGQDWSRTRSVVDAGFCP